jgi:hypothetical protein
MIRHIDKSLQNLTTIDFPSIREGRVVEVRVSSEKGRFEVQLDGMQAGQLNFDEIKYCWYLTYGDLNDPDLVKEIGERIEARYN